ncbi:MAG: VCBS repeat-containing protein, partial [Verrucomicrobiales bacterium]|nr:VCBS repeat-containing protein [Verrucomicrobiales bacterium]
MRQPTTTLLIVVLLGGAVLTPSFAAGAASLSWEAGPGFRWLPVSPTSTNSPGFSLLPPAATGITFTNRLSLRSIAGNRLLSIGSGVALGDVDGDGWVDLYLCSLEGPNALFRNLGNGRFQNVAAEAGVDCPNQWSIGAALVDLDGDRDLDLLVNSLGGGTRYFANLGNGRFQEEVRTGFFRAFGATSFGIADLEGDGDLDVYVTNYRTDTFLDRPSGLTTAMRVQPDGTRALEPLDRFVTLYGKQQVPVILERGEVDVFYLNVGGARFRPVPWTVGVFRDSSGHPVSKPPTDWGLSVMFRDLNGDRHPDLYVCNDFIHWPDRLWINQEGRFFQAATATALGSISLSSMAVDVADINRDGFDDFFVAEMLPADRTARARQRPDTLADTVNWPIEDPTFQPEVPRNTLQLARGDGSYAEIATLAGVAATDWTPSALFMDVDLDGWDDLLTVAGNSHDVQDADFLATLGSTGESQTREKRLADLQRWPDRNAHSRAFRNRGDLTFEEVGARWGFDQLGIGHGMALGDLDNDGDLDVVVNAMNEPARILRNNAPSPRIGVRLRGSGQNSRGIGARITLRRGGVALRQVMVAAGRYASSDDPMRVFAFGADATADLEVLWRNGSQITLRDVRPNRIYEIDESSVPTSTLSPSRPPLSEPLFEDVADSSPLRHTGDRVDDFARQPLLPRRLSSAGPSLAWADLNDDGLDDLLLAGGPGGRLQALMASTNAAWHPWEPIRTGATNAHDPSAVLFLSSAESTGGHIIAGNTGFMDQERRSVLAWQWAVDTPATPVPWHAPKGSSVSSGPLAAADVDQDGDLDLFVGGHALPDRYPEAGDSFLLRSDTQGLRTAELLPLRTLVQAAAFSDFDDDGDSDLLLACEWDSPRVLRNEGGKFEDATRSLGLDAYAGLWNGIAIGDFDEDGRLDFVASNWGRNWRIDQTSPIPRAEAFHASSARAPAHLYFGDFAGDGSVVTILASSDPVLGKILPWRERKALVSAIPSLGLRAPDHRSYGNADIATILGESAPRAGMRHATWFESTVFLNRGTHFLPVPLPIEAQFSTSFGISVADFDGDGHEDLFLAQNFFGVDHETSRQDAGRGLLLLGDG